MMAKSGEAADADEDAAAELGFLAPLCCVGAQATSAADALSNPTPFKKLRRVIIGRMRSLSISTPRSESPMHPYYQARVTAARHFGYKRAHGVFTVYSPATAGGAGNTGRGDAV